METAFHPSVFIQDELDARGWSLHELAGRMDGSAHINRVSLELYMHAGPHDPGILLGETAAQLSQAFGVSDEFFSNLEQAWREAPTHKHKGDG